MTVLLVGKLQTGVLKGQSMSLHTPDTLRSLKLHNFPCSLVADCLDKNSPIREFDIYLWIYIRTNSFLRGKVSHWYSVTKLSKAMGKDKKTIRYSLRRLQEAGHITEELSDRQIRRAYFE